MRSDARGLAVTCDDDAALASMEDFSRRLLRLAPGTDAVFAAAERHGETPLLQLFAASAYLYGQTAATDRAADPYLERAAALSKRANAREERWRLALVAWRAHAFSDAAEIFERLTEEWPRDLLAAKTCEFLYYVLGQQHEAQRFRRHVERVAPHHHDDPDLLAMLAFARELGGDLEGALAAAERALEIEAQTPWADHALSHVWIRRGEVDAAIAYLAARLPGLAESCRIIHSHNAWHLAVHYLERVDTAAAFALLDGPIWREGEDLLGNALDAIALLWRLEMAGCDASSWWDRVAAHVERWAEPLFMPFVSAHLAYALGRAGRDEALARLLGEVRHAANRADRDARRAWAGAGTALVGACGAFGKGDFGRAADLLAPAIEHVTVAGGSDAQCDLFRLTFFVSSCRAGRRADARAYLERLLAGKTATPLDERWRSMAS